MDSIEVERGRPILLRWLVVSLVCLAGVYGRLSIERVIDEPR